MESPHIRCLVSIWSRNNVTKGCIFAFHISIIEYDDMRRTLHFNRKFYQLNINTSHDKGHTINSWVQRIMLVHWSNKKRLYKLFTQKWNAHKHICVCVSVCGEGEYVLDYYYNYVWIAGMCYVIYARALYCSIFISFFMCIWAFISASLLI